MHPLNHAIPGALASILRGAPLSPGKVDFVWRATVGPAMQRVTAVHLEGGELLVEAATAQWAREVTRSSGMILKRVQNLLGPDVVKSLRVRPLGKS